MFQRENLQSVIVLLILANSLVNGGQFSYDRKTDGGQVILTPIYSELIVRFKNDIAKEEIHQFGNTHNLKAESIRRGPKGFVGFKSNDLSRGPGFAQSLAKLPAVARIAPIFKDQNGSTLRFVPGRILVQFDESFSVEASEDLLNVNNFRIVSRHVDERFFTIEISDSSDLFISIEILNAINPVVFAEPDYLVIECGSGTDPDYDEQWYLENGNDPDINIEEAWTYTYGSNDIWIAPLEYSFNDQHEEHSDKYKKIYDYNAHNGEYSAIYGSSNVHSSMICGFMVAEHENDKGIKGIAPNSYILPISTNGDTAPPSEFCATYDEISIKRDAIDYARSVALAQSKKVIIVMSWSTLYFHYGCIEASAQSAYNSGLLLVSATGNDGSTDNSFPSKYSSVLGVGNTTSTDHRASDSNYGSNSGVDLAAPGTEVYSTGSGTNGYYTWSGTSFSAPIVAAVAALVWAAHPYLTNSEVRSILTSTADKVGGYTYTNGKSAELGYGRVNAGEAVAYADSLYQILVSNPPATPANFNVISVPFGSKYRPKLTWSANSEADLDGYKIERKWDSGSWAVPMNGDVGPGVTTFTDVETVIWASQNFGTAYYKIRAYDDFEDYSGYTATKSIAYHIAFKQMADGTISAEQLPSEYALKSAYPNPFNPSTTLQYELPDASRVSLAIYNVEGHVVRAWDNQEEAGYRQIVWNGTEGGGRPVPSGIYLYRLVAWPTNGGESFTETRKMLLLK